MDLNNNNDSLIDYESICYRCGKISDIEDLICVSCGASLGEDTILSV